MGRTRALRRRNNPESVRARVLDEASALFQAQGYHATGMRAVMEAAGLSSGAVHHHFPTKESLAVAVISERVAPAVRDSWIEPVKHAASFIEALKSVLADIIRGIDQRGAVNGCPLNNLAMELSLTNTRFREALRALFAEWQEALEQRIAKTSEGSRWTKERRRAAASFIVSSYSGAMNLAKASQSSSSLKIMQQKLIDWLDEQRLD